MVEALTILLQNYFPHKHIISHASIILFMVCAIGALCYGYMRLKGISVSDLMYVKKRDMANAVESISKHFEQVSAALAAKKEHLTQRIDNLDGKLNDQKEISNLTRKEVGDANKRIENLRMELSSIHQLVSNMDDRVNSMVEKQDLCLAGIMFLCQFDWHNVDHQDTGDAEGLQHIRQEIENNFNLARAREISIPRIHLASTAEDGQPS